MNQASASQQDIRFRVLRLLQAWLDEHAVSAQLSDRRTLEISDQTDL